MNDSQLYQLDPELVCVRAEMTIAGELGELRLFDPKGTDESSALLSTFSKLSSSEKLDVAIDLRPLRPGEARAYRNKLATGTDLSIVGLARSAMKGLDHELVTRAGGQPASRAKVSPSDIERLDRSYEARQHVRSLHSDSPLFDFRILLRAQAHSLPRAKQILDDALSGLRQFSTGSQWLKVQGIPIGGRFIGTDLVPWKRRQFDQRFTSYKWSRNPARTSAAAIGPLVTPPTKHNYANSVRRSGGKIPAAPLHLPTYTGAPTQLPLGIVRQPDGTERLVALRKQDTLFQAMFGGTGHGKTQLAETRFIQAVQTDGGLYLDPHEDAVRDMKHYLVDHAHRIIEISTLAEGAKPRVGWNLFDVTGLDRAGVDNRHTLIVDAFTAAFGWTAQYSRAILLLTMTARTLLEVARRVPADTAPTMFQILPLLTDSQWRDQIVQHLPEGRLKAFWDTFEDTFTNDNLAVLTGPLDRMAQTSVYLHLLGQSTSTFSFRTAMDNRNIVFLKVSGSHETGRLLASLMIGDLMAGFHSRLQDNGSRNPFWADLDEVPEYEVATRSLLVSALQQYRKAGARLTLMAQQPHSLGEDTRQALLNNASVVETGRVSDKDSSQLGRRYGPDIDAHAITVLPRYNFVSMITMADGSVSPPFQVRGVMPRDVFGPPASDQTVAEMNEVIARNSGMVSLQDVVEHQRTLDNRILQELDANRKTFHVDRNDNNNVTPIKSPAKNNFLFD